MESKLLLLTGPAAGEVARVLQAGMAIADPRQGASCDPWWDEVRDYWAAPRHVSDLFCGCKTVTPEGVRAASARTESMGRAVCSLPSGEEWLVGLVLPEPLTLSDSILGLTRQEQLMPARLAILAPEPPPLLVERVRSWGGEMWHCRHDSAQSEKCTCRITAHVPGVGHDVRYQGYFATWPEAVRAALVQS